MAETCKSCGKQWQDHLGVEPTCALLREAQNKIALLEKFACAISEIVWGGENGWVGRTDDLSNAVRRIMRLVSKDSLQKAKVKRTPRANSMKKRRRSEA